MYGRGSGSGSDSGIGAGGRRGGRQGAAQPTPRGRGRGRGSSGHGGSMSFTHSAYEAGASSSASVPVARIISDVEERLTLEAPMVAASEASSPQLAPPPTVAKFVSRPGYGTVGTKCLIRANHFLVQLSDRDLHHYDVSILFLVIPLFVY